MWNVFDVDVQPSGSLEYTTRILKTETKVCQLSAGITQRIRKWSALLKSTTNFMDLKKGLDGPRVSGLISPPIVVSRRKV